MMFRDVARRSASLAWPRCCRSLYCLLLCSCVGIWSGGAAWATVTGSFTGGVVSVSMSPGSAAFIGLPVVPGGAFSTSVSTTLEGGVPPVPAPDAPPIPPEVAGSRRVEVLFLTDTTGSMNADPGTGGLADFQAAIAAGGGLLADIESSASSAFTPDPIAVRWAVAQYKDVVGSNSFPTGWTIDAPFGTAATASATIAAYTDPPITDGGGLDPFEAGYAALSDLAALWSTAPGSGGLGGAAIGDAERLIIWTGDGGSHEGVVVFDSPSLTFTYPTTFQTLTDLREQSIAVYAMNIAAAEGGLDETGSLGLFQATTVTAATGGTLTNFAFGQTPASLAAAIKTAIIGPDGPIPPGGSDAALLEMNNITLRVDPTTLGPWVISFVERQTLFPSPLYEFDFSYPSIPPPPGAFPMPWGTDGPMDFLDSWGFEVISPVAPDSRFVTFELRVDGVLLATAPVFLTNEAVIPEPATLLLPLAALAGLLPVVRRRRR